MLDEFLRFVDPGDGWLFECAALVLIPYIHEDIAILGAAALIVENGLPVTLAVISLYAGMVTSDISLYGLGILARRSRWADGLVVGHRISRLAVWVTRHAAMLMVLSRIVPGVMFPVYVACGFCRVSFPAFSAITMLTAAVYLPAILYLAESFGEGIFGQFGYWSWLAVLALFALVAWSWSSNPNWRLVLRGSRPPAATAAPPRMETHGGMPRLGNLPTRISLAERLPPPLFYIPLVAQWIALGLRYGSQSLPTAANPCIELGGLWGESKSACLDMIQAAQRRWLADYTVVRRGAGADSAEADAEAARRAVDMARLAYPVVAKPDIGWRGFGVRLVADESELARYVAEFPEAETIILQRRVDWDGEAGVLYARLPGEAEGRLFSLTLRYFPHVVGDGRSPLRELILSDQRAAWKVGAHLGFDPMHFGAIADAAERIPAAGEIVRLSFIGSNRVGGLYRDASDAITPALTWRFDAICKSMPEFWFGRFDVRFKSLGALLRGEDFRIIEVNGAGAESINVWDPGMRLDEVYRLLFAQQALLFRIGARNRARGFPPSGLGPMLWRQWRQHRLIRKYPPSS